MANTITTHAKKGSYQTDVSNGRHNLLADEPFDKGGTDKGPNPYDLLTAALATCTSITLQMYAGNKGWDLQSIDVNIVHDKDYAKDCIDCEEKGTKIDVFKKEITLKGNLDEKQKERLLQIADRCPVHKTLNSQVEITTTLI